MSAKFKSVGTIMTVVGGAITASLGLIIKKTVDAGDAYNDMSLRTGVAVETLSALAYAAKQSGTDIEGLELGIKFLTKGMDDASKGTGTAKDAFTELGISVKDSEGKLRPTIDVLKEAATKIAAIENPAKQSALAMELFGARSGTQLVPLLKLGGAGIDELMKKAEELGIVISTKDAQAADAFKDSMNTLKEVLGSAGRDIANILIPPLKDLVEKATDIVKKVREWADAHKPLVDMLVKVGATIGSLAAVGGPILLAASAFLKMQGVITALGTISSGPIGIAIIAIGAIAVASKLLYDRLEETVGGMRDFREGLKSMSLTSLDSEIKKLTDSAEQLQKRFYEIPKGLGQQEILTMIDEINKRLGMLYEKREELTKAEEEGVKTTNKISDALKLSAEGFATVGLGVKAVINDFGNLGKVWKEKIGDALKTMSDRLYELTHTDMENQIKKIDDLKKAYLNMGIPLEQVTTWYDAEIAKIKELGKEEDNEKERKKTLADAYKSVGDRIYELTHTEMETNIKKLGEQKQAYIDLGMSIEEANKWYDAEIAKLKELNPKLKEAGKEVDTFGELMKTQFAGATNQISMATTALSNFTKEGLIAAIVSVKMSFLPLIYDLQEAMAALSKMFFAGQLSAVDYNTLQIFYTKQLNDLYDAMNEKIKIMTEGLKEYQRLSGGISGGTVGSFQTGTSYVPKTGLAMVHQGEKIIPANQNTTNNSSYAPTINFYNPVIRNDNDIVKFRSEINKALDENRRQLLRRGSELALGM
jgi:TP901 family phage tail tape measure protein